MKRVKRFFILAVLCFSSVMGFGQVLELEKASPFTAVKWEDDQPLVQFNKDWYQLDKLDKYKTQELLDFCKQEFGAKWKKRFSEDLVEVLTDMGSPPHETVTLLLTSGTEQKTVIGTYTLENRQQVLKYNYAHEKKLKKITKAQAQEDIVAFQQILVDRSSYIQLTDYDYNGALQALKKKVSTSSDNIDINYLTHELAKIMAELGDRHSSVRNDWFEKDDYDTYDLQLPFSIAPLNGKAVALKHMNPDGNYDYLYADYPYIKSINGLPIETLIDSLVYRSKKAPDATRFSRGLIEIQQLGRLYFINNLQLPEQIDIVFTNGQSDKTEQIELTHERFRYRSKLEHLADSNYSAISEGDFESIAKVIEGNMGYLALPEMYDFKEVDGLEPYLDSTLTAFYNTKALIIDLRYNPGGTRDFIQKMAPYIIPESESPWVANVAYLRTDEHGVIHNSMSSRHLYSYNSDTFNEADRKAIDVFSEDFTIQRTFDTSKFSQPHYMVLESGNEPYPKPIYILINEHSFSAATVFTTAFKGLPNVSIVGVTTDGSSGNSKLMHLKHSNIRVRVSTMLSFQRNGKTLDGHGTEPDLYIPEQDEQVLKGADSQLQKLIDVIMED